MMEKVLKRVTHHKKQASVEYGISSKSKDHSTSSSSSINNKRYSADDNFYTHDDTCSSLREDERCNRTNYFTISNRGDLKRNRRPVSSMRRSKSVKQAAAEFSANGVGDKQLLTSKDDVTSKKFLKVFNSGGESSRGAKDWFTSNASNVMDFVPKILTKRSSGKKGENELYRSNSFKFERFERMDSDTLSSSNKSPISRQISLCDDYSLPVDFVVNVNKRPVSLDSGSFWSAQSPNGDQVEVLNLYCNPKDSKSQQNLTDKRNSQRNKEIVTKRKEYYSACYDDSTEDGDNEDDEPTRVYENFKQAKSPHPLAGHSKNSSKNNTGRTYTEVRKSPYYYGDLLIKRNQSETATTATTATTVTTNTTANNNNRSRKYDQTCDQSSSTATSVAATAQIGPKNASYERPLYSNDMKFFTAAAAAAAAAAAEDDEDDDDDDEDEDDSNIEQQQRRRRRRRQQQLLHEDNEEMAAGRRRHIYETAFDSKVCRANETFESDTVANHMMERCSPQLSYNSASLSADNKCSLKRLTKCKVNAQYESSMDSLTQHLFDIDVNERNTLLHGYSSASTSTIPLPQSAHLNDSTESFSESSPAAGGDGDGDGDGDGRINGELAARPASTGGSADGLLPREIIQNRIHNNINNNYNNNNNNNNNNPSKNNKNINNNNTCNNNRHRRKHLQVSLSSSSSCNQNEQMACYASDTGYDDATAAVQPPKSYRLCSKILEIKSRPRVRGHRFSSTESMTTSSSGGSLESIRSSTSEGNCSTTSTDSRRSSSLSSHSSDSAVGSGGYHFSLNFPSNRFANQTKMHVLSPISDKSFQEGGSEGSEVNRSGNSQMVSPEEQQQQQQQQQPPLSKCAVSPTVEGVAPISNNTHKTKRRTLQNGRNAIGLSIEPKMTTTTTTTTTMNGDAEIQQCSDSGISIESRSDMQILTVATNNDFSDLPFDMPKLRRRRLQQMQVATQNSTQDTSSSATSVDLKDLPFDMPKLRRTLKSTATQDSDAASFDEPRAAAAEANENDIENDAANKPLGAHPLQGRNRKSLGLSLNLNEIIPAGCNIDGELPLERQGWYHGAISRMEAENELRNREEGSYLVRNSESAKHDYSLSLKSAKGFMHMRIQRSSDADKFILGQFSSPFDSIPLMIKHYSSNQLPIRGAEHMCLLQPVIAQLL